MNELRTALIAAQNPPDPCDHEKADYNGTMTCMLCGREFEKIYGSGIHDCSHTHPRPTKSNEKKIMLFSEAIQSFTGISCHVSNIDKIKDLATKNPSKRDVKKNLRKLKLRDFYLFVHHIHHLITGIPYNEIDPDDQRKIEKHYRRLVDEYDGKSRFFNSQYVLFVLLRYYGYNFGEEESFIPNTDREKDFFKFFYKVTRKMQREERILESREAYKEKERLARNALPIINGFKVIVEKKERLEREEKLNILERLNILDREEIVDTLDKKEILEILGKYHIKVPLVDFSY